MKTLRKLKLRYAIFITDLFSRPQFEAYPVSDFIIYHVFHFIIYHVSHLRTKVKRKREVPKSTHPTYEARDSILLIIANDRGYFSEVLEHRLCGREMARDRAERETKTKDSGVGL